MKALLAVLGAALLAGGCTAMSESECVSADWYQVGREDGLEGKLSGELSRYFEACSQFGVTPDRDEYAAGREQGLLVYCTQDSGYWEGRNGRAYSRVCPLNLAPAFLTGYRAGQAVHSSEELVLSTRHRIQSVKDRIDRLEDEIRELESPADSDNKAADEEGTEGDDSAASLNNKHKELGALKNELETLRAQRVFAIAQYTQAIAVAGRLGYPEPIQF